MPGFQTLRVCDRVSFLLARYPEPFSVCRIPDTANLRKSALGFASSGLGPETLVYINASERSNGLISKRNTKSH